MYEEPKDDTFIEVQQVEQKAKEVLMKAKLLPVLHALSELADAYADLIWTIRHDQATHTKKQAPTDEQNKPSPARIRVWETHLDRLKN